LFKRLYYHRVKACVFVGGSCFKRQKDYNDGECTDFGSNSVACESIYNLFEPQHYDTKYGVDDYGNSFPIPITLSRLIIFF
jgi:hypothetical protein